MAVTVTEPIIKPDMLEGWQGNEHTQRGNSSTKTRMTKQKAKITWMVTDRGSYCGLKRGGVSVDFSLPEITAIR